MLDIQETDVRPAGPPDDIILPEPPPLLLAGSDEDEAWEPHLVRGID